MIENLLWLSGGIVIGVIHHAYLQPRIARAWEAVKAFGRKHGIGVSKASE